MDNRYEAVVVFDSDLEEEAVNAQVEKIGALAKTHNGSLVKYDFWGRRQLAYPIRKKEYGVYAVLVLEGEPTLVNELKRQMRINDAVLRSLVVAKDQLAPDFVRPIDDDPLRPEGAGREGEDGRLLHDDRRVEESALG